MSDGISRQPSAYPLDPTEGIKSLVEDLTPQLGGDLDLNGNDVLGVSDIGGGLAKSVTFAPASAAANVCEVTITITDYADAALAGVHNLDIWLSDDAAGAGLTATDASGTVAVKAASGNDLSVLTAKKQTIGQTLASGVYILEITDTAKTGFYVCAAHPVTGLVIASAQLVNGDYGA